MLSREDRILSELIVSRGLATPEEVEGRARELEDSNQAGLVEAMVSRGELDAETGRKLQEEAREIGDLLSPEVPEGRTLGEFRLLREIGRGGMGIVYEAEQASLGRRVALKVLPAGAALDERVAIRFLREARTTARLRHPGIVPVFATGREQGVLFFAMELVDGESLAQRIDRGPVPAREAAAIASEITEALQYAHEAGLVHRDVKPDNVILGSDGRARLADFGLVHDLQGTRLTRSQYVLGTPAYSSPEQARGEPVDPRSDVYGAGAVIYAMLSGTPPFTGEVPAAVIGRVASGPPPPLGEVAPGTSPELVAICERAMARDPEGRYQSAGALARALRSYLDEGRGGEAARGAANRERAHPAAARAPEEGARASSSRNMPDSSLPGVEIASPGSSGGPVSVVAAPSSVLGRGRKARPLGVKAIVVAAITTSALVFAAILAPGVLPRFGRRTATSPPARSAPTPSGGPVAPTAMRAGLFRGACRLLPTVPGPKPDIAISPDGQTLAYVSGSDARGPRIYLQNDHQLDGEPRARRLLMREEPQSQPTWSPDGTRIACCVGRRLEIVEMSSGAVESTGIPCGESMSWSPDGRRLVYGDQEWPLTRLRILSLAERTTDRISPAATFQPSWGPNGRIASVAMRDGQYDIWTFREDGSDARRVTNDTAREMSPVWSSIPGRLYYGSNNDEMYDLWEVDLDPDTGQVGSPPIRVSRGWVGSPFTLTASRQRERLALVQDVEVTRFWSLTLNEAFEPSDAPQRLKIDMPFDVRLPQRAPDREEWIAVVLRGDAETLHRFGTGGGASRVTDGSFHDGAPRWSPDGATIAFHSDRSGEMQIWTVRPDGTRLSRITRGPEEARFPVWSPDGKRLAHSVTGRGPSIISIAGGDERPIALPDGLEGFTPWSWSSTGDRIAGSSRGIVVLDLESGGCTRVADFGEKPLWVGSTALLFTHGDRIFFWNGKDEPRAIWSTEPSRLASSLSAGPGGREIYFASAGSTERVWQLDLDPAVTE